MRSIDDKAGFQRSAATTRICDTRRYDSGPWWPRFWLSAWLMRQTFTHLGSIWNDRSELFPRLAGDSDRPGHPLAAADGPRIRAGAELPSPDHGWVGACWPRFWQREPLPTKATSGWLETATILPAIVCLVWTFGSWPLLKRVWPAIAFLVFMLPLPDCCQQPDRATIATDRGVG